MLVKHMELGFHIAAPVEWQICWHALLDFIDKVVRNHVDERSIIDLIEAFADVVLNYKPSDNLEFFLFLFPEIVDVIKLVLEHPKSMALFIPLLFGSQQMPLLDPLPSISFSQYIKKNHLNIESGINLKNAFLGWWEQEPRLTEPTTHEETEIQPVITLDRFKSGRKKLESIDQDLLARNVTLRIGIVLEYDQNQTTFHWLKTVLDEKIKVLAKDYGDLTQITWKIFLVDARAEKSHELIHEINRYFGECSLQFHNIAFQYVSGQQIQGKAEAVKFGLGEMGLDHDIVGFIDLSNKIDIREIGHLIASIYESSKKGNDGIAIGSRRMEDSQVKDKAFSFLLRSGGLNWIVKGMFPLLYQITDTQTGFKFFSKNAWISIQNSGLFCQSLAFDVEILQQGARLGLEINEFPINFHDNTLDREGEVEVKKIIDMFSELLAIRSWHPDSSLNSFEEGEGRLLGGGAEHMVFKLEDNTIVKIPHEHFDPHFFGLLKHVIFKHKDKMKWEDQDKKMISSECIRAILDHPRLNQYIPLLRAYKEFNIFIMKIITNIENKNYQSSGYEISEQLGRDLVIPFCFVNEPFSLKLDGQWRSFSISDQVKRTVSANPIVKDQILLILSDNLSSNDEKKEKILLLIDDAIDLFKSLWKRGLFDLDANIMNDMGYYPNTNGKERLMVLDPGEMLNDPDKINLAIVRRQIAQRYDFKELQILLKQLDDHGVALLEQYQLRMSTFLDFIEEDLKKPKEFRLFGEDQRIAGSDFYLVMPSMSPLPSVRPAAFRQNQTVECFERSKNMFHLPYSRGVPSIQSQVEPSFPFLCAIPHGISTHPRSQTERLLVTETGSIGPILHSLDRHDQDWLHLQAASILVILDGGTATRSSLLKYATERGTKGDLLLEGKPVYERIAANFSPLLSQYLPEGYLVLASSDDLIDLTESDCQAMYHYFHPDNGQEAPGVFWSEVPNYEEKFLPHTIADTIKMLREPAIVSLSEKILKQIPLFKRSRTGWAGENSFARVSLCFRKTVSGYSFKSCARSGLFERKYFIRSDAGL